MSGELSPMSGGAFRFSGGIPMSVSADVIDILKEIECGSYGQAHVVSLQQAGDGGKRRKSKNRKSILEDSGEQRLYTLKSLDEKATPKKRESAVYDMMAEALILTKLPQHNNIVQLHATSPGFWKDQSEGEGFLLLSHIPETLQERLTQWRGGNREVDAVAPPSSHDRVLEVALPVARALAFLHGNKICFRDLKPENVGFDGKTVKLLNFGCARVLKGSELVIKPGRAGTPRYMAPEVMRRQKHGASADVYSFAMLLWEITTLYKPFEKASCQEHLYNMVAIQHERPPFSSSLRRWKELQELLTRAWDKDPAQRPTSQACIKDLELALDAKSSRQSGSSVDPAQVSRATQAA